MPSSADESMFWLFLPTVTVGRNSSNIDSLAEDGTLNSGASVQLVYSGSTIGWHSL